MIQVGVVVAFGSLVVRSVLVAALTPDSAPAHLVAERLERSGPARLSANCTIAPLKST